MEAEISRNYFPHDLLFEEILVRLPVKSLTVYKSVCKKWLYTIESSSFRAAHRRRHICYHSDEILISPFKRVCDPATKSSSLLPSRHSFGAGPIKVTSRPLDVMLPPEMSQINWPNLDSVPNYIASFSYMELPQWGVSISVLGPIRTTGIYCIVASVRWARFPSVPSADIISICNPATRDYKLANPFPPKEMARLSEIAASKFYRGCYGFGVAADGDYKVVLIITWCSPNTVFLSYVYSLKQGVWKKIVDSEAAMVSRINLRGKPDFPQVTNGELCPQAFVNSCWHWLAMSQGDTCNVLSFDVDNDKFKLLYGPPSYRGRFFSVGEVSARVTTCRLSVLNDHLAALYHTYNVPSDCIGVISVWMMMEYGDEASWINVWRVNLDCGPIKTLVGISYSLREDGNGGIHIHKISYQDYDQVLVSCDEFGLVQQQPGFDTYSCIFWNNLGISAYSETLERL